MRPLLFRLTTANNRPLRLASAAPVLLPRTVDDEGGGVILPEFEPVFLESREALIPIPEDNAEQFWRDRVTTETQARTDGRVFLLTPHACVRCGTLLEVPQLVAHPESLGIIPFLFFSAVLFLIIHFTNDLPGVIAAVFALASVGIITYLRSRIYKALLQARFQHRTDSLAPDACPTCGSPPEAWLSLARIARLPNRRLDCTAPEGGWITADPHYISSSL